MTCTSCGATLDVSDTFPGASVRCGCGADVRVPMPTKAEGQTDATAPAAPNACPRCGDALEPQEADGVVVAGCPGDAASS